MKILVIGGGGREHALVWKLAQSRHRPELICAPGNPGIAGLARCVPVAADDLDGLTALVANDRIDLTVIGPERPLVLGLADRLRAAGHAVMGPSAAAARLEGSKDYAKRLMTRANIPTAPAASFDDAAAAVDYVRRQPPPIVIKADGLAQGKGVVIAGTTADAVAAVEHCMTTRQFGDAGSRVVIEQFLDGREVTFMAVTDGEKIVPLLPSQDHKRLLDGDRGPNTGGMGAYAPVPWAGCLVSRMEQTVFRPLLAALQEEGICYQGVIYAGTMVSGDSLSVLEFNCRFGDPEAQAVLPLLSSDFVELCEAVARGRLAPSHVEWSGDHAACIVLASKGYPDAPVVGQPIRGLSEAQALEGVTIFHAGTCWSESAAEPGRPRQIVTAGGRVLGVTACGPTLGEAVQRAYGAVDRIGFAGVQCRRDIAAGTLRLPASSASQAAG